MSTITKAPETGKHRAGKPAEARKAAKALKAPKAPKAVEPTLEEQAPQPQQEPQAPPLIQQRRPMVRLVRAAHRLSQ